MFCPKCGNQILESAAFCSVCGTPTQKGKGTDVPISKGKIHAENQERVLMDGLCNRVKGTFNVQNGKAVLTTSRFIYNRHTGGELLLAGALVNLTGGKFDFEIPLTEIEQLAEGRQGLSKTIIFQCKDGAEYNFYFAKREEWKIKLEEAIRQAKACKA